jgi:hypothetical protein
VLFLALLSGSGWHLSATSWWRIHAFRFVFSEPFAVRTTLRPRRRILRASRRDYRLLDAFIMLAAWLTETFAGTGSTGR